MKKYIAIFAAAALALSLSACANSATKEPASSAASTAQTTQQPTAEVTKEPAAQTPEATLPDGQTKSPDHFQDLASLDLIRDVTAKSASMVEFTYKYAPGYEGKKITGFTVQSAAISFAAAFALVLERCHCSELSLFSFTLEVSPVPM